MKKITLALNLVLLVSVIVLFVLVLSNKKECCAEETVKSEMSFEEGNIFPVAYINTDSLLMQYEYAKYLNEELMKKEEKSRTDFNIKVKKFQNDAATFQNKVQNNGFLSLERAQKEEKRLMEEERKLQEYNSQLSNVLMGEQQGVMKELLDSLNNYLEVYNKDNAYKLIINNSGVLYGSEGVNITNEIIEGLNSRYVAK